MHLIPLLKVCERSLSGSGTGPNPTAAAQFVRAEMLPSGYLIRPCDGGGSIIHIVDHLNLEVRHLNNMRSYISFHSLHTLICLFLSSSRGMCQKYYDHFMNHQRWWLKK